MVPLAMLASLLVTIDLRPIDPTLSPRLVRALRLEAEAIWRPYGVDIQWADDCSAAPALADVSDLSITTIVEAEGLPPAAARLHALGAVRLRADGPDPIHVSSRAVRAVLASRPLERRTMAARFRGFADLELGRALGRVLAHEVGHVLLDEPLHRGGGLMRAQFTPDELASGDRAPFTLSSSDVGRLRSRVPSERRRADRSAGAHVDVPGVNATLFCG